MDCNAAGREFVGTVISSPAPKADNIKDGLTIFYNLLFKKWQLRRSENLHKYLF